MREHARLLESAGRYVEQMAVAQRLIDTYPGSVLGYLYLARGKIFTGSAQEAIPLLKKTIQLNPRDAYLWDRYWGFALLLIGRYEESIVWHQRALVVYPDAPRRLHAERYRMIAAANALSGQIDEARRAMAKSNRLWSFATIRPIPPRTIPIVMRMWRSMGVIRTGCGWRVCGITRTKTPIST